MRRDAKTHFADEHRTVCGIEADRSRFGIWIVDNMKDVTCKKCLKKLEKQSLDKR